jgi:hypothetical protein
MSYLLYYGVYSEYMYHAVAHTYASNTTTGTWYKYNVPGAVCLDRVRTGTCTVYLAPAY